MAKPFNSYWSIVEPLFDSISIDDPEAFAITSSSVRRPALLLFAAHFTLSELWNGGFLQFFFNSTGLLAPEAIEAFRAIGMPKLAEVVATAAEPLGSPYPRDRSERWDALLSASGFDAQTLTTIFDQAPNRYLAFLRATESLGLDRLNKEAYALAESENSGFQSAATASLLQWKDEP